jgi:hypothetical protein
MATSPIDKTLSGAGFGGCCGCCLGFGTLATVVGAGSLLGLIGGIMLLKQVKNIANPSQAYWTKLTGITCVTMFGLGCGAFVLPIFGCMTCAVPGACCGMLDMCPDPQQQTD